MHALKVSLVLCTLLVAGALASHFRGGKLEWTRSNTNPNLVTIRGLFAWRSAAVEQTGVNRVSGPAATVTSNSFTNHGDKGGYDETSQVFTATLSGPGVYTFAATSCCRISNLQNNHDSSWYIPVTIDTTGNDLGGPVVSSPVIKKVAANSGLQTFSLAVTDPDFHGLTCSVGTLPGTGYGTSSVRMTVAPNCDITFDTTGLGVGTLHSVFVNIQSSTGSSMIFDFIIETVAVTVPAPICTPDAGQQTSYVLAVGQSINLGFTGTTTGPASMSALTFGTPSGSTVTHTPSSVSVSAGQTGSIDTSFSYTATQADQGQAFAVQIQYDNGQQTTCSFTVSVPFRIPPQFTTFPADVTVQCGASTDPSATGQPTVTYDPECPSGTLTYVDSNNGAGVITRTWSATDTCPTPLTSNQVQTITVADTAAPVWTEPVSDTATCVFDSDPSVTGTPVAEDNCSSVTVTYVDSVAAGGCPEGSVVTRTWTATDATNNQATLVQNINVCGQCAFDIRDVLCGQLPTAAGCA